MSRTVEIRPAVSAALYFCFFSRAFYCSNPTSERVWWRWHVSSALGFRDLRVANGPRLGLHVISRKLKHTTFFAFAQHCSECTLQGTDVAILLRIAQHAQVSHSADQHRSVQTCTVHLNVVQDHSPFHGASVYITVQLRFVHHCSTLTPCSSTSMPGCKRLALPRPPSLYLEPKWLL